MKNQNVFINTNYDSDEKGYFGEYGGRYVPEMFLPALERLGSEYLKARKDKKFIDEFVNTLNTFVGRPSPMTFAENLTRNIGGAKIYLKNEGCNLTGAHKINHCIGQAMIAKRLKKSVLIAETGAGQHGVATATVAARYGMKCTVFMGTVDMERQMPNVFIMRQLGATVIPVNDGSKTLKDAVNAAMKYWITNIDSAHYVLGSCLGPHPYPSMNRDFQSIIGNEIGKQILDIEKRYPDYVVACVGGGSNAMGAFTYFLDIPEVNLIGVEAGGLGVSNRGYHAVRMTSGVHSKIGILHGYKSIFLQTESGNIDSTHSISAGLDYPGIGPQLAYLHEKKRVQFQSITDDEAVSALNVLSRNEGIIPALESSHALAYGMKLAKKVSKEKIIVVNLSGRGDKDLHRMTEL